MNSQEDNFNNAHKEFGKIDKDVVKITGQVATVEPLSIDRPRMDEE